jgi:hypothetical protein
LAAGGAHVDHIVVRGFAFTATGRLDLCSVVVVWCSLTSSPRCNDTAKQRRDDNVGTRRQGARLHCSRTTPCKTSCGAIAKTADGGIINCLDPSGFGFVTITKSITIDCGGTFGGIVAATTNGRADSPDGGVEVTTRP